MAAWLKDSTRHAPVVTYTPAAGVDAGGIEQIIYDPNPTVGASHWRIVCTAIGGQSSIAGIEAQLQANGGLEGS